MQVAVGGVFVGGGIAPKVLPALQHGTFMHALMAKGRFFNLMVSIEVRVALNPQTALVGAARYALRIKAPPVTHPSKFQASLPRNEQP